MATPSNFIRDARAEATQRALVVRRPSPRPRGAVGLLLVLGMPWRRLAPLPDVVASARGAAGLYHGLYLGTARLAPTAGRRRYRARQVNRPARVRVAATGPGRHFLKIHMSQIRYQILSESRYIQYSPVAQLSVQIRTVRCQMSTLKLTLRAAGERARSRLCRPGSAPSCRRS